MSIYIGGLPPHVDEDRIVDPFKKFGPVTGRFCAGFAFIDYPEQHMADVAMDHIRPAVASEGNLGGYPGVTLSWGKRSIVLKYQEELAEKKRRDREREERRERKARRRRRSRDGREGREGRSRSRGRKGGDRGRSGARSSSSESSSSSSESVSSAGVVPSSVSASSPVIALPSSPDSSRRSDPLAAASGESLGKSSGSSGARHGDLARSNGASCSGVMSNIIASRVVAF
mmetsp:Transcript_1974/g.7684  ORF Transcript_1974/g.7684 Transcript_1974/m.7684 type:complete len:229 (-) Transcript_1974:634-1320(-)